MSAKAPIPEVSLQRTMLRDGPIASLRTAEKTAELFTIGPREVDTDRPIGACYRLQ
jgi:hypothetical protein